MSSRRIVPSADQATRGPAQEVVIDVTRLLVRLLRRRLPTGVDRVTLAYVEHHRHRALALVRWRSFGFVMNRERSDGLFAWLARPTDRAHGFKLAVLGVLGACLRRQAPPGALLWNTDHSGLSQQGTYAKLAQRGRFQVAFVVHDLIPLSHPEYCRDGESARHALRMTNVLQLACGVVTNSRSTLDALQAFAKRSSMPMPRAIVAHLGGSLQACPGQIEAPLAAPYFVVLGTIEPRKNHLLLLLIWRDLAHALGPATPKLVLIGQRGWESENVADLLERCKALQGHVIEEPACSDSTVAGYLQHARALLFPAFAEGYGMPLVEALAAGVPVIASDLVVFHEIAQDVPEYVHPLDGIGWRRIICDYAQPASELRAAQIQRLGRFVPPTWAGHFARARAIEETLGEPAEVPHGR